MTASRPAWATSPSSSPTNSVADLVRMTVQLRNGEARGSGTVVASKPGLTLVLTAAHVVKNARDPRVELHRHNLGTASPVLTEGGGWPRLLPASLVAIDPAADVAILKVEGMVPLPYVARVDPNAVEPVRGQVLTSVGVDRGLFLTRWRTTIEGTALVDLRQDAGGPRRFLVTTRHPEHGRSGGGLFLDDGTVVGLCTGMVSLDSGRPKVGLFASTGSVLTILRKCGVTVGPSRRSESLTDQADP